MKSPLRNTTHIGMVTPASCGVMNPKKPYKMKPFLFLVAVVMTSAWWTTALAQAPKTISYQGYLKNGTTAVTGTHNLTFNIYTVATGGTNIWTEAFASVSVTNGNFNVILGKTTPLTFTPTTTLYMGIQVDGGTEISPRVELSSSFYSIGLALPYTATISSTSDMLNLTNSGAGNVINATGKIKATQFVGDGSLLTNLPGGGTVTNIATGTGLTGGPITGIGTISLANTSVTAGSYGTSTSVGQFTVDGQGRLTAASSVAIPTATTTATGLLTNTDWNTFNNKLGSIPTLGGDISGSLTSVSVDKLKGTAVVATAPTLNQILQYNGTNWGPSTLPTASPVATGLLTNTDWNTFNSKLSSIPTLGGDISGALTAVSVDKLKGTTVAATAPALNQVLQYNGTNWAPATLAGSGTVTNIATGTGLTGGPITGTGTIALANTAVTANTYGTSTSVGQFTVDAQGRLTAASNVAIPTATTSVTGLLSNADWNTFNNKLSSIPTLGGDISGTLPASTVTRINGTSLAGLTTGILKNTTGTGVPSIATAGTDYQAPITLTTTGISGAATFVGNTLNVPNYAGTAYSAGTGLTLTTNTFSVNPSQNISTLSNLTTNGLIKTSGGTGALSIAVAGTDYLTGNQSIILSGDISGSGATAITTAIGAGKVTNAMLGGSIASSKLIGTDIATLGTVTSGVWNGTKISEGFGGTNQTTYATGDLLYASAANTLSKLPIGTSGQVLTVNTGVPSWSTAATSGWSLTGTSGTTPGTSGALGTNFIGTTDTKDLDIVTNNTVKLKIKANGQLEIYNTGNSTFLGQGAGTNDDHSDRRNTFIGNSAGSGNTTGAFNVAVGMLSLTVNNGTSNTANGYSSLYNNSTGSSNTASGYEALFSNVTGSNATAIGAGALKYSNNTTTPFTNGNVAVGFESLRGSTTASANTGYQNTAIGYQTLQNNSSGEYNTALGYQVLLANATGINNTGNGYRALYSNTASDNTATGFFALVNNSTGINNTANGSSALKSNTTGGSNTAGGYQTLFSNTSGTENVASGNQALYANTTGNYNTATGSHALETNIGGISNTAYGYKALGATTGGSNTATGALSLLTNVAGTNNTALGYGADVATSALTNATAIGYNANVGASNTIQLGNGSVTAVYVGTGTTATLVAGGLQITGGALAAGKVLTSDATGLATWATPSSGGWGLTGTSGTVDGTNFLGTTDNVALNFKVNNQNAGRIDPAGPVFLGYQAGVNNANATAKQNTGIGSNSLLQNTTGNYNVAIGNSALAQNTTGAENTAVGATALQNNTTGVFNSGFGYGALYTNSTGSYNTAFGNFSGVGNTTGNYNTAYGNNSLYTNTVGSNNTSIGNQTLSVNSAGSNGTAVGALAMQYYNDSSSPFVNNNVAVGYSALQGSGTPSANTGIQNSAVGYQAMASNTSGQRNAALGYQSMSSNTTGNGNTAVGSTALSTNSTGGANTAIGTGALFNNTASNNTATGNNALNSNVSGTDNAAFGVLSLAGNTASQNTGLGAYSLQSNTTGADNAGVGNTALLYNTTGSKNTSLGSLSGNTTNSSNANISGSSNTFLGYASGPGSTTQLTNATAIGANATVNQSNSLVLGSISGVNGATVSTNVGIGTSVPQSALDVVGQVFGRNGVTVGIPGNGNQQLQLGIGSGFSTIQAINPSVAYNNLGINPSGGNVGIGTSSPGITTGASKYLTIANGGGYSTSSITSLELQGNTNGGDAASGRMDFINGTTPTTISRIEGMTSTTNTGQGGLRFFTNNGTLNESMRITSAGNVGIGTTTPVYPFQVNPTANYTSTSVHGVLQLTGATTSTPTNLAVSIYSTGAVLAPWFWAFSDKRIKEKVSATNTADDLNLLMRLKVTDYNYIDKVTKGPRPQKGFIAQEVKEVLPDAVNILPKSEFIPSIYSRSKSISKQSAGLVIELTKAHDLKVGDRIRFLDGAVEFKETVIEVPSPTSFMVKNASIETNTVFVYGKEISDMHTIEYDRIYTLGISAIQELNKKLTTQQQIIDSLKEQGAQSKKKIALLEATLNKMVARDTELNNLKSEIEKIKAALGLSIDATVKKANEKTASSQPK